MRRTMIAVGLFLGIQASGVGAAQPTLAQQVVAGCGTELESYCKGVTLGEGRLLACLHAYEDKLSSRCDYTLYDAATTLDHAVTALAHGPPSAKEAPRLGEGGRGPHPRLPREARTRAQQTLQAGEEGHRARLTGHESTGLIKRKDC